MKSIVFLTGLILAIITHAASAQSANCPRQPDQTVYIRKGVNDNASALIDAINQAKANTWVLLESDAEIKFSSEDSRFIVFATPCVTLASYQPQPVIFSPAPGDLPPADGTLPEPGSGRTPHSLGPALIYNPSTPNGDAHLIDIDCTGNPGRADGARILGIRVVGPKDEDLEHNIKGIFINRCQDVEIANNEIHGWGAAISVFDLPPRRPIPDTFPEEWFDQIFIKIHNNYIHHNQDGESGGYGVDVQHGAFADIFHNVFDFNKHSITAAGDSGGYRALSNLILKGGGSRPGWKGTFVPFIHVVDVHGSKDCLTRADALCGDAGSFIQIVGNTFQYSKTTDIKIRGKTKYKAEISGNIFARSSQDDAIEHGPAQFCCVLGIIPCFWLCASHDDNVLISGDNKFNDDAFGKYGICDVDGDGIDDLVLMTGTTWWFSSAGRYPWSFLRTDPQLLTDVQLGDFDGDGRCDAMQGGEGSAVGAPHIWRISSGAKDDFKLFVPSIAPLNEVRFGRFDPDSPGPIDRPTHAFWRNAEGFWFVTPISDPRGWTLVQSSGFALSDLRFGSFRKAGVTDVLSNVNFDEFGPNRWATSHPGKTPAGVINFGTWENLNRTRSDPVEKSNIFIGNMDGGNSVDDVLQFNTGSSINWEGPFLTVTPTWQRSKSGMEDIWREWKSYVFEIPLHYVLKDTNTPVPDEDGYHHAGWVWPVGFVGQFSASPGASTLTIDESRIGHFFWKVPGAEKGWLSLFHY